MVSYCPSEVANWSVVVAPALIPIYTRVQFVRRNLISLEIVKICSYNWRLKWCHVDNLQKKVLQDLFIVKKMIIKSLHKMKLFLLVLHNIKYKNQGKIKILNLFVILPKNGKKAVFFNIHSVRWWRWDFWMADGINVLSSCVCIYSRYFSFLALLL